VYQLQGKAESVSTHQPELQAFLSDFAAERLAILQRHEAGARVMGHYDFNNTYQYVINREETHLQWLQNALAEFDVPLPAAAATIPVPAVEKLRKKVAPEAYHNVLDDDARRLSEFVAQWRPRVESVSHARHRLMLGVILGESLEHQRLFAQAASGIEDVLGKRTAGAARVGEVLPARWQE
jgi:Mn-containing catalase